MINKILDEMIKRGFVDSYGDIYRLRKAWVLKIQSTQTTCSILLAVIFTAKRLLF